MQYSNNLLQLLSRFVCQVTTVAISTFLVFSFRPFIILKRNKKYAATSSSSAKKPSNRRAISGASRSVPCNQAKVAAKKSLFSCSFFPYTRTCAHKYARNRKIQKGNVTRVCIQRDFLWKPHVELQPRMRNGRFRDIRDVDFIFEIPFLWRSRKLQRQRMRDLWILC